MRTKFIAKFKAFAQLLTQQLFYSKQFVIGKTEQTIILKRKMPKSKTATSLKINELIKEFGSDMVYTDGSILFCSTCSKKVNHDKKYYLQQHIKSEKHVKGMQLIKTKTQMIGPLMQKNEFYADLTKIMIATDIPFYKLKSEAFKSFFEKHVHRTLPDESTVRKNYLKDCYYSVLQKIRLEIGKNPIFVSIDETTDKAGRSVTNVIVGPLHENG